MASRADHDRDLLTELGVPFQEISGVAQIRTPGMPAADYVLGADTWKECGTGRVHTGGVRPFMSWYLARKGNP